MASIAQKRKDLNTQLDKNRGAAEIEHHNQTINDIADLKLEWIEEQAELDEKKK